MKCRINPTGQQSGKHSAPAMNFPDYGTTFATNYCLNIMLGTYWEHFPHEADIGVRGVGATKEEAFEEAAVALTAVITDPECVAPLEEIDVECEAPDDELLLAEWLNALIYQMATRRMLFARFEVWFDDSRLGARAWGEPVDIGRHKPAVEVKGATYTQLKVARDEAGEWLAQCVVDV
jgi:tRNA nucleotidyltransferase (CCA-adding enzyme)